MYNPINTWNINSLQVEGAWILKLFTPLIQILIQMLESTPKIPCAILTKLYKS
jgi:hypothetical protein